MKVLAKILRFGPNELDFRSFELRRAGRRLPLSKIPMDLLALLLERSGSVVTRDQIAARLWTNPEALDVERGINNAINRIRQVLNDDPARPRYIETVIGIGYRFVAPVEEVLMPEPRPDAQPSEVVPASEIGEEPSRESSEAVAVKALSAKKRSRTLRIGVLATVAIVALLLLSLYKIHLTAPKKWQASEFTTESQVTAAAISPDGKLVAYSDAEGLFLRVVATGSIHRLRLPIDIPANRIEWFPDDIHLLLSSLNPTSSRLQIWLVSIVDNDARPIREDAEDATPSPADRSLAFTLKDGTEIWITGTNGENPRLLKAARKGERFSFLFWADSGRRLSFVSRRDAPGIGNSASRGLDADYRWDYGSLDAQTGQQLATEENIPIDSACTAPDSRILYLLRLGSSGGETQAIWEVETDQRTGAFRSRPRHLESWHGNVAHGLTTTSDGAILSAILGSGQPDVYVADLAQPGPRLVDVRRLTSDRKNDFPHAWTPDSRAVIFESDRTNKYHLYRQSLDSHTADTLVETQDQEVFPQLSPNGRWLMFVGFRLFTKQTLYRMPIAGGNPQRVPLEQPLDEFRCGSLPAAPCVLRETKPGSQFVYYTLDPETGKGHELARTSWAPSVFGDWALSPDSKTVAMPYHDVNRRGFRLVPLDAAVSHRPEQEVKVAGMGSLWGIAWAADGKSWFAESRLGADHKLIYIDDVGRIQTLRSVAENTWAVPSPDGRKIAFVDYTVDSNVWLWR